VVAETGEVLDSLAPRRRRLAFGVIAVVAAAALVIVGLVAAGGHGQAPLRPVAQDVPGPVLLIPGYGDGIASLQTLQGRLRAAGRQVTIVGLPGDATGDLDAQARAVRAAVKAALADGHAQSVDLVGYSDGGVVARIYVRNLGGGSTVRRVVTLGSPQHGTNLAATAAAIVPGVCTGACAQVLPGSDILRQLNSGSETPPGPRWVSLWTTQDQTVTPPDSAHLAGAENVVLQDICADDKVSHGGLPADPLVTGIVLASIGAGPPGAPSAGQCGALRRAGSLTP
jgi:triacylglycerol lipase